MNVLLGFMMIIGSMVASFSPAALLAPTVKTFAVNIAHTSGDSHPPAVSYKIATPRGSVRLYTRPRNGARFVTVGAKTPFGTTTRFGVISQHHGWLKVSSHEAGARRYGFVHTRKMYRPMRRTTASIRIDLSDRRLTFQHRGRVVVRSTVSIGSTSSPTPRGVFSVTDKLPGSRYGSYYGCCILALSTIQTHLPPGWSGDNRMAIHGAASESSVGINRSAGCLRARARTLRKLMRLVLIGTRVVIVR